LLFAEQQEAGISMGLQMADQVWGAFYSGKQFA
jgi:hypothetical protein